MSRQNKAAKKRAEAKQWTKIRKDGGKGPARTTPKHGKVKTQLAIQREELHRKAEDARKEAEKAAQKAANKAAEKKDKPKQKKAA